MIKKIFLLCALTPLVVSAQHLKSGYIDPGVRGTGFGNAVKAWKAGDKWSEDDNFYISRVKPHLRFRNQATQVDPEIDATNDKNLLFWVPINENATNALPNGVFDSEVFPMWNYITHWGNWSSSLMRIPAAFTDVAHKNGVSVSCVAGIPYGNINDGWKQALYDLADAGPTKVADYMEYYGIDGMGYNSEFDGPADLVQRLESFHQSIVRLLKKDNRMPLVEIPWYDGTQHDGQLKFDRGLTSNNAPIWGEGGKEKTVLFFNYNWNKGDLLKNSVENAQSLNRTPLDLYAGFNMQGSEPTSGQRWTKLIQFPVSIGLWGAHERNMFWETRAEFGAGALNNQRAYMERVERWFSSGVRNPLNDLPVTDDMNYSAYNHEFFGMSKMMSARSALSWNLDQEPFITYFNLGNGRFFNFNGERRNDNEWYNIGIQDHLPTWRWWFTSYFLGTSINDLPEEKGLDAEFIWDDAWFGGSLMHVFGNTQEPEYLHLFKTSYALKAEDVITLRYKVMTGKANASLILSAEGDETTELGQDKLQFLNSKNEAGVWAEKKFTVGTDVPQLVGKKLAMVAMRFENAEDLDVRLGEFSIIRPGKTAQKPPKPVIESAKLLSASQKGVDGKIIFNMPNNKGNKVCYNIDVNTSLFSLWAQQEGEQIYQIGATTSWAGLLYSIPVNWSRENVKVRLGVQANSLDFTRQTEIVWSDYMDVPDYDIQDNIVVTPAAIHPGKEINVKFTDPMHATADWSITDAAGSVLATQKNSRFITLAQGLPNVGDYTVTYTINDSSSVFPGIIQVVPAGTGSEPQILSLHAEGQNVNWKEGDYVHADLDQPLTMTYTGVKADGKISRGVRIGEQEVGLKCSSLERGMREPFTVSFWIKPDEYSAAGNALLNLRDKTASWPNNQWGWFYTNFNQNGTPTTFVISGSPSPFQYQFAKTRMTPKVWHHMAFVFDFDELKVKPTLYIDGIEQEVTSWTIGNEKQPLPVTFAADAAAPRQLNGLGLGGNIHTTQGMKGAIDQLEFHDHALTAAEVKQSMDGTIPTPLCRWTFENEENEAGGYPSEGTKNVTGGAFSFASSGEFKFKPSIQVAGCPFLNQSGYDVATAPKWDVTGGQVLENDGKDTEGLAKLQWGNPGLYASTFTLSNDYGADSRQFNVIAGETAIEEIQGTTGSLKVLPNPFTDRLGIIIPEAGNYTFIISDLQGKEMHRENVNMTSAGTLWIHPQLSVGYYLLNTLHPGETFQAVKLIKN